MVFVPKSMFDSPVVAMSSLIRSDSDTCLSRYVLLYLETLWFGGEKTGIGMAQPSFYRINFRWNQDAVECLSNLPKIWNIVNFLAYRCDISSKKIFIDKKLKIVDD